MHTHTHTHRPCCTRRQLRTAEQRQRRRHWRRSAAAHHVAREGQGAGGARTAHTTGAARALAAGISAALRFPKKISQRQLKVLVACW
eukprot:643899-Pelagomonas_calceolata.AAC.3